MVSGPQHVEAKTSCQPTLEYWVDRALDNLFPQHCLLCQDHPDKHGFCAICLATLPALERFCLRCAIALHDPASKLCGACLHQAPVQDASWAAFQYQGCIRELLWRLKFRGELVIAKHLGELMLQRCPKPLINHDAVLVPAPLHLSRLRQRGFNQARELIRPLTSAYGLESRHDLLIRCQATREQSRLNAQQRQHNVAKAFHCNEALRGRAIILFDDVMTTGATMRAMAHCLKQAGAGQITALCLARA